MSFPDPSGNGQCPEGGLTLIGSTLYGTTEGFGTDGDVFEIGTEGTGYSVLYAFTGGAGTGDGRFPYSDLTLSGTNLYGTTSGGGSQGDGTVFQIGTNGSGYSILHSFSGSADGSLPMFGSLALGGSTLYGMDYGGGSLGDGSVFKVNTNGSGFTVLHFFTGGSTGVIDGKWPWGSVTLSGSTLYGMTAQGGVNKQGTIFKISIDGSGYDILHNFTGSDGKSPFGDLILSGSTIYGEAAYGDGAGSIFQLNTDGSGFRLLHSFTGSNDGGWPYGSLLLSGSMLYGTTNAFGSNNDGTIFSLNIAPATIALSSGAKTTIITGGTATLGMTVSNSPSSGYNLNYTLTAAVLSGNATLGPVSPAAGSLAPGGSQSCTVSATSTSLGVNTISLAAGDPNSSNLSDHIKIT